MTAVAAAATAPLASGATDPVFVSSNPNGGWSEGGYYVHNNVWNGAKYQPCTSTLHAWSHAHWYAAARMNNRSGDGAVKAYPNAHRDFNRAPVSSFESITSGFAETSPQAGIYDFAYDLWLNGIAKPGCTEIMVWTENFGQTPSGRHMRDVSFDGRTFKVYATSDKSYLAFVAATNFTAGTLNLLALTRWTMSQGWLGANATLDQICYGVEIVSTDDAEAKFEVTGFSIDAKLSPKADPSDRPNAALNPAPDRR